MTETPELNRPLVEAILTQLTDHPELHNQKVFGMKAVIGSNGECGTTHCVAGWAAALSPGVRLIWSQVGTLNHVYTEYGVMDVDLAGRYLIGLTEAQAEDLFWDYGSTEHIIGRLKDLLNEAPSVVGS
jgi:hypothetical protein